MTNTETLLIRISDGAVGDWREETGSLGWSYSTGHQYISEEFYAFPDGERAYVSETEYWEGHDSQRVIEIDTAKFMFVDSCSWCPPYKSGRGKRASNL